MYKFSFVICLLISLWAKTVFADKVERALNALEKKDFDKAISLLDKVLGDEPQQAGAHYVKSLYFFTKDNPAYDLKKAYWHIGEAIKYFGDLPEKIAQSYQEVGITKENTISLNQQIVQVAFTKAEKENTVAAWNSFLEQYALEPFTQKAIERRDNLEFTKAQTLNTYQAYRDFLEKYPNSHLKATASENYEKRLFEQQTATGTWQSFEYFANTYPKSPYHQLALSKYEELFYKDIRKQHKQKGYEDYLKRFPQGKNRQYVERILAYFEVNLLPPEWFPATIKKGNETLKGYWNYPEQDTFVEASEGNFFQQGWAIQYYASGLRVIDKNFNFLNWSNELPLYVPLERSTPNSNTFDVATNKIVIAPSGKVGILYEGDLYIYNALGEFEKKYDLDLKRNEDLVSLIENGVLMLEVADKTEYKLMRLYNADTKKWHPATYHKGVYDVPAEMMYDAEFIRLNQPYAFHENIASVNLGVRYSMTDGKSGKWGFIDTQGNAITAIEYDEVRFFIEGYAAVKKGESWGMIDKKGKVVLPIQYDHLSNNMGGVAVALKSRHIIWIDLKTGEELKSMDTYDYIGSWAENMVYPYYYNIHKKREVILFNNDGQPFVFTEKGDVFSVGMPLGMARNMFQIDFGVVLSVQLDTRQIYLYNSKGELLKTLEEATSGDWYGGGIPYLFDKNGIIDIGFKKYDLKGILIGSYQP